MKNCSHQTSIFGICIDCGHDNGAIDQLNQEREKVFARFAEIRKKIAHADDDRCCNSRDWDGRKCHNCGATN